MDEPRRVTGGPSVPRQEEQRAADDARTALRVSGAPCTEPDERIGPMLAAGEVVLALRRAVDVGEALAHPERTLGRCDLYLTDRRLILVGDAGFSLDLGRIVEAEVRDQQLLLRIDEIDCLVVNVVDPRVLRVEIGAARAALRGRIASAGSRHSDSR